MKRTKTFFVGLCVGLMVLGMAASASAVLIIDANSLPYDPWVYNSTYWTTMNNANPTPQEVATLVGYSGTLSSLYKNDIGPESGVYSGLYDVDDYVYNSDIEPIGLTINYTGVLGVDPYIQGLPIYLYVKDGQHTPAAYAFDLSGRWNGTDPIILQNFWATGGGSISHAEILGIPVPEPTSLLLLGFGLVGLAGAQRMLKK